MNFLDFLKNTLVPDENPKNEENNENNYRLSLGVLLYLVATSDNNLSDSEKEEIIRILEKRNIDIPGKLFEILRNKEKDSVDIYSFTNDINPVFNRNEKIRLIEDLFRVACADNNLSSEEIETIRTISTLLRLSHDEFISAKVKILDNTECGN